MEDAAMYDEINDRARRDPEGAYRAAGFTGRLTPAAGGKRLRGLCPWHKDTNPSFVVDVEGDYAGHWGCFGCNTGGDLVEFYARLHRVERPEAAKALAGALGIAADDEPRRAKPRPARRQQHQATQPADRPTEDDVARLAAALARDLDRLAFLRDERCLSPAMIEAARLGVDGDRIAIPVYTEDGNLLDVRRYKPGGGGDKMVAWATGTGSARLYYPPGWRRPPAGETLIITEGELDCLAVADLGYLAVTNSNGAGSWAAATKGADWDLAGVTVIVAGDNDQAGQQRNTAVARWAYDHGAAEVRAVQWPADAPQGYDLTDYIRDHGGDGVSGDREAARETLRELLADAEVILPPAVEDMSDDADDEGSPVADKLIRLALDDAHVHLFRDENGDRYAEAPESDHIEVYPLPERGGGLRDWLSRRYRELTGRSPHAAALAQALTQIRAEAAIAPVRKVALRVAEAEGALWVDLCTPAREVVRVTADGWTLTREVPETLVFARPPSMRALPYPVSGGGGLAELRGVVNAAADDDYIMFVAAALAALRPGYPYPVLVLLGEAGTGKSFAARVLRYILDPQGDEGTALAVLPSTARDLYAIANSCHVLAFDNLSAMPGELSDAMSALATGGGFMARRLYTDSELSISTARRPVVLTGIGSSAHDLCSRADLLDRVVGVNLAPIPDDQRMPERDLWAEVRRLAPAVLSDLLDATSTALRHLPSLKLPVLPRLTDFAEWVVAAEPALPWSVGEFMRVYGENRERQVGALLDADPIAPHLRDLAATGWTGTPAELLSALDDCATESDRKRRDWPGNVRTLGRRLTLLAPALRRLGVEIIRERESKGSRQRSISLCITGE